MIKQDPDKPWIDFVDGDIDFVDGDIWFDRGTGKCYRRKDHKWVPATYDEYLDQIMSIPPKSTPVPKEPPASDVDPSDGFFWRHSPRSRS